MSEKPQAVAIGAFLVGGLLIAITLVLFALGTGFGQQRDTVVMVFDGSVKGLTVGAPVALRGVQIGQVTDIDVILKTDTMELIMMVQAEIRGDVIKRVGSEKKNLTEDLIARGLRAQLRPQSLLTGLLYIQLDFHPGDQPRLADVDSPYTQIPTIPSDLEVLAQKLEQMDVAKLADQLQETISGLNSFVTSKDFQALPTSLATTLASVTDLSRQLREQVESTGPQLDRALESATDTLDTTRQELPKLWSMVQESLEALDSSIGEFGQAMGDARVMLEPGSPLNYQLDQALQELTRASRALRQLAESIEEQPGSLIWGKRGDKP